MTFEEIIDRFERMKNDRGVEIWARAGVSSERSYGIGVTKLKDLAKEVKRDHELAKKLWESNIHDGKLLSTMIEEPKQVTREQLQAQVTSIGTWLLADKFVENVVRKSAFAEELAEEWTQRPEELVRRCGWTIIKEQAARDKKLPDDYFLPWLERIERELPEEQNWVRDAMNYAIIAIGSRSKRLNEAARKVALNVGRIEIEYGDNSCQTPDAIVILESERTQAKLG